MRAAFTLGGQELRWPRWGGSRKTCPMFFIIFPLGPGPGLGAQEDSAGAGAFSSWYEDRV